MNVTRLARLFLFWIVFSLLGCRKKHTEGTADVPPDTPQTQYSVRDFSPRWSHDGRRIAFLRSTEDRRMQLFVCDAALEQVTPLLKPELLSPDRELGSQLALYTAPNALAWSPDDHHIAFPRMDWFRFEDGERLPGAGLWSLDVRNGRVVPLATHPPRYSSAFYTYRSPHWSPDGRYLSYTGEGVNGQRALFVRSLAAQTPQEVPPRFDDYEDSDGAVWEQQTSPAALIYRRRIRRSPQSPITDTVRRIVLGSAEGRGSGEVARITTAELYTEITGRSTPPLSAKSPPDFYRIMPRIGHLAVSPDGTQLAFSVTSNPMDWTQSQIAVVNRNTKAFRYVTHSDSRGYFAPVWIGSDRLGMLSPVGKGFEVCLLTPRRQKPFRIGTIETSDCDWSPDRSRIVYTASSKQDESDTTLKILYTGLSVTPAK